MNTPAMHLIALTIDCSDAGRSARFYAALTGGEITGDFPEHGYSAITTGAYAINFQAVHDYTAPRWPSQERPQQFHLDLSVADLSAAVDHAVGLGAAVATAQPGGDAYRVMLDPDGHPFCLCPPRR